MEAVKAKETPVSDDEAQLIDTQLKEHEHTISDDNQTSPQKASETPKQG